MIIKGIQSVADARRMADAGVDAVVLSNHGGRQLDRAPVPLTLVSEVVDTVGDRTEVWMDTGVMTGADIVAAVALGAQNVLVGRAYLYGLMAGGERGVERATAILIREMRRTMQLLGARSIAELDRRCVKLNLGRFLALPGVSELAKGQDRAAGIGHCVQEILRWHEEERPGDQRWRSQESGRSCRRVTDEHVGEHRSVTRESSHRQCSRCRIRGDRGCRTACCPAGS